MKHILAAIGIFILLAVLGFVFLIVLKAGGLKTGEVQIGGATFKVEIADTPAARSKGLSGRGFLANDNGMLFIFPFSGNYGFWMKDMKFPIDIIWIKEGTAVGMIIGAEPETEEPLTVYNPPVLVDMVLEINAGLAQRFGIKVGDVIQVK